MENKHTAKRHRRPHVSRKTDNSMFISRNVYISSHMLAGLAITFELDPLVYNNVSVTTQTERGETIYVRYISYTYTRSPMHEDSCKHRPSFPRLPALGRLSSGKPCVLQRPSSSPSFSRKFLCVALALPGRH